MGACSDLARCRGIADKVGSHQGVAVKQGAVLCDVSRCSVCSVRRATTFALSHQLTAVVTELPGVPLGATWRRRGRPGGKGPQGIGLDGRSFSLRQEPNRKPPPDRPSPPGRKPSNTAAQRHPSPRAGAACRAEEDARQLSREPHNEREGEAEPANPTITQKDRPPRGGPRIPPGKATGTRPVRHPDGQKRKRTYAAGPLSFMSRSRS